MRIRPLGWELTLVIAGVAAFLVAGLLRSEWNVREGEADSVEHLSMETAEDDKDVTVHEVDPFDADWALEVRRR
jgi:hypothetical protein